MSAVDMPSKKAAKHIRQAVENSSLAKKVNELDCELQEVLSMPDPHYLSNALTEAEVRQAIRQRRVGSSRPVTQFENDSDCIEMTMSVLLISAALGLLVSGSTQELALQEALVYASISFILGILSLVVLYSPQLARFLRNNVFKRKAFKAEVRRIASENRANIIKKESASKKTRLAKLEKKVGALSCEYAVRNPGFVLFIDHENKRIDVKRDVRYSNGARIALIADPDQHTGFGSIQSATQEGER